MALPLLAFLFLVLLALGYRFYGGFVARQLGLKHGAPTPARTVNDGVDFVPTRPFYLFAQHFSAIAAAGPIVGPIAACISFGWLPCVLWIGVGVVFIGAVHDFLALAASIRHGGRSIAEITRQQLGKPAGRALLAFILIALVYVIVAFADNTASSFVSGTEELEGTHAPFNRGGAVAAASVLYLLLALLLGLVQKLWPKVPLVLLTALFVPATFLLCWYGTRISTTFVLPPGVDGYRVWGVLILLYCGVASLTPVWALLQPRGYLGGFILYSALGAGIVGIFLSGVLGDRWYALEQPAWKGFSSGAAGPLVPFLFVTIACGACSGFHGLVCSGTTSKQVDRETHARPVGYGAMLAEAFVAVIALVTVMIALPAELLDEGGKALKPGQIYANGIGRFLTLVVGDENYLFARTFGAMAFSTFVFDTLDVATRLGRYIVQELTGWRGRGGALFGTVVVLVPPAAFLLLADAGSFMRFWTLFGASNQLLAALTLLTLTLWLKRSGRRWRFAFWPMLFVGCITVGSLVMLAWTSLAGFATVQAGATRDVTKLLNGLFAATLVGLALFLAGTAIRRLREPAPDA